MKIRSAQFVSSHADVEKCPVADRPEFAFIGRSNVGKSSLINMLTNSRHLAKTSGKPGKTQTINHFIIDESWYLVDLPGYGYAQVSKSLRSGFGRIIENYVTKRENLACLFVLVDIRLDPQPIDLSFIEWVGSRGIPIAIIFTKCDKLSRNQVAGSAKKFGATLLKTWEELPPMFYSSAESQQGREEILTFIGSAIALWHNPSGEPE